MAPIRGETLVERASRLRLRSRELKGKACFNVVVAVLRAKPEICVDLEQQFKEDGHLDENGVVGAVAPKKRMNKKGPLAICDGAADGLAATDIEDCGDDIHSLPVTPFDKNVTAYGDLRRGLLQTAFAACDPSACSRANTSCLMRRGKSELHTIEFLKLLQLGSDIDPGEGIPHDQRSLRTAVAGIVDAYVSTKQNRFRGLIFQPNQPVNYGDLGIHRIRKSEGHKVIIENRFTKVVVEISDVPRSSDVFIDMNWSVKNAVLRVRSGSYRKPLGPLFGSEAASVLGRSRPCWSRGLRTRFRSKASGEDSDTQTISAAAAKKALMNRSPSF